MLTKYLQKIFKVNVRVKRKTKKFMKKRFKRLLLEIHSQPMAEQERILNQTIEQWMEEGEVRQEQVDDILVIGVRV